MHARIERQVALRGLQLAEKLKRLSWLLHCLLTPPPPLTLLRLSSRVLSTRSLARYLRELERMLGCALYMGKRAHVLAHRAQIRLPTAPAHF